MRYQRVTSNLKYVQDKFGTIYQKIQFLKQLDVQVKALKKIGNTLGELISEVCKIIIRRFKDYLFTIIDEETEYQQNQT